jgi:hypothetical protein
MDGERIDGGSSTRLAERALVGDGSTKEPTDVHLAAPFCGR